MIRVDIIAWQPAGRLLRSRWPQFLLRAIFLAGFIFTILAGLLGSPVGSHNFAIIFVWIAWWSALKLAFIPFGGRSWCSLCPIPLPGEWLQRGGILETSGSGLGLGRRWPKRLRGYWLQAGGFLLVGLFGAVTLTTPVVTGWVLAGIFILALALSLVFERRAFCRYLCPIGGFTGLYAQAAPVELRVKDRGVCARHAEKTCYAACSWGQYPLALKSSADCGLCLECVRVCPEDNLAVNLRPWGGDLGQPVPTGLGETFLALVMLASALADAALFLGPWGELKSAAYAIGSSRWLVFAFSFLALALLALPGVYGLSVWLGNRLSSAPGPLRKDFARLGQALIPLGLLAWIAFTISFAFTKSGYVIPVLSDPLGWGWNLLGVTRQAWVGAISPFSLYLQVGLLALGAGWSARTAMRVSRTTRQALPVIAFILGFTLAMQWLLVL